MLAYLNDRVARNAGENAAVDGGGDDLAVNFEKVILTEKQATKILNGVFEDYGIKDGTYRVYNQEEFWGVGVAENGAIKIKAYVR